MNVHSSATLSIREDKVTVVFSKNSRVGYERSNYKMGHMSNKSLNLAGGL